MGGDGCVNPRDARNTGGNGNAKLVPEDACQSLNLLRKSCFMLSGESVLFAGEIATDSGF
jgi:hypothetical protein